MTSFLVVWDGTNRRPLGRQLATPPETPKAAPPLSRGRRVLGYTVSIYQQARVYRALKEHGPQTRAELLARITISPDQLRQALGALVLSERVQVAERIHTKQRGRCRYVYEVITR